jgi:hypothetical protein
MWKKMRLRAKRKFDTAVALKQTENRVFEENPPPLFDTHIEAIKYSLSCSISRPSEHRGSASVRDDYASLLHLSESFYGDQESRTVKWSLMLCPSEFRAQLEQHVPEANFDTTEQWIIAIKNEIDSVLLPMVKKRRPDPNGYWEAAAKVLAAERMLEDLTIEDRLDATSDRALRRLFWLKGQAQMEREAQQKVISGKSR